jgi:hypothetical protein
MKRRISLRTLLLIVTLMAIFFGYARHLGLVFEAQHQAVARLASLRRPPKIRKWFPRTGWNIVDNCYEVVELDFRGCDDWCFPELVNFPYLKRLDAARSTINDETIEQFLGECPRLEQLNLLGTAVSDESTSTLSSLTALRSLNIKSTGMSATSLAALLELPQLGRLDFDFPLDNADIKRLGSTDVSCGILECTGIRIEDLLALSPLNTKGGSLRLVNSSIDSSWEPVFERLSFDTIGLIECQVDETMFRDFNLAAPNAYLENVKEVGRVLQNLHSASWIEFRAKQNNGLYLTTLSRPNSIMQNLQLRSRDQGVAKDLRLSVERVHVLDPHWFDGIDAELFVAAERVLATTDERGFAILQQAKRVKDLVLILGTPNSEENVELPRLPNLASLVFVADELTENHCNWIGSLSELEGAVIRSGPISAEFLQQLSRLKKLESLTLEPPDKKEGLSGEALLPLLKQFERLRSVTIGWEIEKFSQLQSKLQGVSVQSYDD